MGGFSAPYKGTVGMKQSFKGGHRGYIIYIYIYIYLYIYIYIEFSVWDSGMLGFGAWGLRVWKQLFRASCLG